LVGKVSAGTDCSNADAVYIYNKLTRTGGTDSNPVFNWHKFFKSNVPVFWMETWTYNGTDATQWRVAEGTNAWNEFLDVAASSGVANEQAVASITKWGPEELDTCRTSGAVWYLSSQYANDWRYNVATAKTTKGTAFKELLGGVNVSTYNAGNMGYSGTNAKSIWELMAAEDADDWSILFSGAIDKNGNKQGTIDLTNIIHDLVALYGRAGSENSVVICSSYSSNPTERRWTNELMVEDQLVRSYQKLVDEVIDDFKETEEVKTTHENINTKEETIEQDTQTQSRTQGEEKTFTLEHLEQQQQWRKQVQNGFSKEFLYGTYFDILCQIDSQKGLTEAEIAKAGDYRCEDQVANVKFTEYGKKVNEISEKLHAAGVDPNDFSTQLNAADLLDPRATEIEVDHAIAQGEGSRIVVNVSEQNQKALAGGAVLNFREYQANANVTVGEIRERQEERERVYHEYWNMSHDRVATRTRLAERTKTTSVNYQADVTTTYKVTWKRSAKVEGLVWMNEYDRVTYQQRCQWYSTNTIQTWTLLNCEPRVEKSREEAYKTVADTTKAMELKKDPVWTSFEEVSRVAVGEPVESNIKELGVNGVEYSQWRGLEPWSYTYTEWGPWVRTSESTYVYEEWRSPTTLTQINTDGEHMTNKIWDRVAGPTGDWTPWRLYNTTQITVPTTTAFWQLLSVKCNRAMFQQVVGALMADGNTENGNTELDYQKGVVVYQDGNYSGVVKTATTVDRPVVLQLGNPDNPNAILQNTGNASFFNKECPYECTADPTSTSATVENGGKFNVRKNGVEDPNNPGAYGATMTVANKLTNSNAFSLFRDNEPKKLHVDVWFPVNNDREVKYDGHASISTILVKDDAGTPNNDFFKLTTLNGKSFFTNKDSQLTREESLAKFPVQKNWFTEEFTGRNEGVIDGMHNEFLVHSTWASEGNKHTLNLTWEYRPEVISVVPVKNIGVQTIFKQEEITAPIEGKCFARFGTDEPLYIPFPTILHVTNKSELVGMTNAEIADKIERGLIVVPEFNPVARYHEGDLVMHVDNYGNPMVWYAKQGVEEGANSGGQANNYPGKANKNTYFYGELNAELNLPGGTGTSKSTGEWVGYFKYYPQDAEPSILDEVNENSGDDSNNTIFSGIWDPRGDNSTKLFLDFLRAATN